MKRGFFITGTDTGVGKTTVSAAVATALRYRGFKVGVMKPAETGCPQEGERLMPQDALFLRAASRCTVPLELIVPYTFVPPITPALAAEDAGVTIDLNHIRACYQRLLTEHDIVLVEGAGGLLAPLFEQATMLDVAVSLDLPVLIVARNTLGTINHTTLTVAAARERAAVLGIVLNHSEPPDPGDISLQTNEQSLRRWCRAPVYCTLPYVPELTDAALRELGESVITNGLFESLDIASSAAQEEFA